MKIAIDAMGGDHGPIVTMAGLANSISEHPDLEAKVFGSEEQVVPFLKEYALLRSDRKPTVTAICTEP